MLNQTNVLLASLIKFLTEQEEREMKLKKKKKEAIHHFQIFTIISGHFRHSLQLNKEKTANVQTWAFGVAGVKYLQTADALLLASSMLCKLRCC